MKNRISLVGFLLSLSAFNIPPTTPASAAESAPQTIEERLSRLTALIREREQQLPETSELGANELTIAKGFADGDDRGWRRSRDNGWFDGRQHGGQFKNSDPWRNGWGDGQRFFDWHD
ncbi:MAG: rSAM-associated Gly-rich repeat protein [Chroococcidiopsidaceae cyanobacterium CP_BM_RX_35]|nr:rSAM-associated Gly-rich repeat protein [Chroococcidiopsidaceae cyanobacterium CP_BM_RX_35]